jgi:uncharacterized protein (DUF58 family)
MAGGGIVGVLMACACVALGSCGGADQDASSAATPPAPITHVHKGNANVLVLADLSEEMDGDRLAKECAALDSLVRAVPSGDRLGLAVFANHFNPVVPVLGARQNRARLRSAIARFQAGGQSAAYDSILQAYGIQRELASSTRANTVLVLAHGEDLASRNSFARIRRLLGSQRHGPRVRVFTVAYDTSPDSGLREALAAFAKASHGQALTATKENVGQVLRRAWRML